MKRSGFKNRGTGLSRTTKLKPKRSTPRRVAEHRVRDPEYRAAVRGLACYMLADFTLMNCFGGIDPDHQGKDRGQGLKASDLDCVPMCRRHHDERQFMKGYFEGWTKAQMDSFCEEAIQTTRLKLGVVTNTDGRTSWVR